MNLIAPIDKKNKIKIQSSRCDFLSIQDLQQHRNIQTSRSANCVDEPNSNKINSELKLDHLLKTQKKKNTKNYHIKCKWLGMWHKYLKLYTTVSEDLYGCYKTLCP